jgi:peptidoglycan/xylan/chitin deacetylase (PgdA/CDA1 family)
MKNYLLLFFFVLLFSCTSETNTSHSTRSDSSGKKIETKPATKKTIIADAATIVSRPQVPILCYHRIRPFRSGESASMKVYIVTPVAFAEQMKALADSGYQTILPDQLYDYLAYGATLPPKPIMITFDDTSEEHFTIGAAEMKKYNFKGVFFIMTISIGRPKYMSKDQIEQLAQDGHAIDGHTWDHHKVTEYNDTDWDAQVVKPQAKLQEITGKQFTYFAYPFGLWNREAIPQLKKRGIKAAYQLSALQDSIEPLYTIRRMIVPGTWSTPQMLRWMKNTFD